MTCWDYYKDNQYNFKYLFLLLDYWRRVRRNRHSYRAINYIGTDCEGKYFQFKLRKSVERFPLLLIELEA